MADSGQFHIYIPFIFNRIPPNTRKRAKPPVVSPDRMATAAQIAANRRNSQKSTGPRSAEGKQSASLNALKSGIHAHSPVLPAENPDDFACLAEDYEAEFRPRTVSERDLLAQMVHAQWLLRRYRRIETELWSYELEGADAALRSDRYADPYRHHPEGYVYSRLDVELQRLQTRLNAAERTFYRALKELRALQANRPQPSEPAERQALPPQIGFVPRNRFVPQERTLPVPSARREAPDPTPQLLSPPRF
jgi:hypothetical protein